MTVTEKTIPTDFLSKSDWEYLSELCQEFLSETGVRTESFSFSIEVAWEED